MPNVLDKISKVTAHTQHFHSTANTKDGADIDASRSNCFIRCIDEDYSSNLSLCDNFRPRRVAPKERYHLACALTIMGELDDEEKYGEEEEE